MHSVGLDNILEPTNIVFYLHGNMAGMLEGVLVIEAEAEALVTGLLDTAKYSIKPGPGSLEMFSTHHTLFQQESLLSPSPSALLLPVIYNFVCLSHFVHFGFIS